MMGAITEIAPTDVRSTMLSGKPDVAADMAPRPVLTQANMRRVV